MRTTVTLDDDLYQSALAFHPSKSMRQLLDDALKSYIHQEASKRLAKMGASGVLANADVPPRRRPL